jgi:hypothetical protein
MVGTNSVYAVTNTYSALSGNLYLLLRNVSGSNLDHSNLEKPLRISKGFKYGAYGFAKEIKDGIIAPYSVPKQIMTKQGKGYK